ncbi:aconitase X [Prauserella oleivorans]|uniref:Aconitase X n=1 Tax=Prauserella oleivorans TaxID=1478153 RepID=A0ABW5WEF3_9PSEU
MQLTAEEEALAAGSVGPAVKWAMDYQLAVGRFFGAQRFVQVRSAHAHCDGEALGEPGVRFLEDLADQGARTRIPLTLDPRSTDFSCALEIGQDESIVDIERRILAAMVRMGAMPTNTCINYQTVDVPHGGEHLAWGDTGTVIYANAVAGSRSNFEGGPAAVAAALTGRVPEYGFHLDECRRGTVLVELAEEPRNASDWGALGCLVGRRFPGYWEVPVIDGGQRNPGPDEVKQLGAALASYGSHAMFHLVGVTPEARTRADAFGGNEPWASMRIDRAALESAYLSFPAGGAAPDIVVFGTPQLSTFELAELAALFEGRTARCPVFATTSAAVLRSAEEYGYAETLRAAGVRLLSGVCFYLMTARDLARRNNLRTIVTNSAKLANIVGGYGYTPVFRTTEACVDAAVNARIVG